MWLILAALWLAAQVTYSSWLPPDFSVWIWQRSVVVGDWLYIEGGETYTLTAGEVSFSSLNSTIGIPLSSSWTNSTLNAISNTKPADYVYSRRPMVWYDPVTKFVYSFGGWPYADVTNNAVWGFPPDGLGGASWQQITTPTEVSGSGFIAPFGSLYASSSKAFYSLGGTDGSFGFQSSSLPVSGLTIFNFEQSAWSNVSSSGYSSSGYGVLGEAHFVPIFGQEGIVIALGGSSPPNQIFQYEAGVSLVDMNRVSVYDVSSGQWYTQIASGDIPSPRTEFCMAGALAADNSSYEIFIYGGHSTGPGIGPNAADYTEIFILSLPSFVWFRVSDSTSQRRSNHDCQLIGGRQMIFIGGYDSSVAAIGAVRDQWTNGLGIFDMTDLTWSSGYDAHAAAYVPSLRVRQYYAQNPRYPSSWGNQALEAIMTVNHTTTNSSNSTTGSASSTPHAASHTPVGAIIGGVVGGVAGLILLISLGVFLYKRHHREAAAIPGESYTYGPVSELSGSEPPPPLSYEMGTSRPEIQLSGREVMLKK